MIDKATLEKLKTTIGFNLGQLEKDYLQHLFLLFLSRHTKDELVFKGGTALQKVYGLNRFSIDLDFTLNNKNFSVNNVMEKIKNDMNNFGYSTELKEIKTIGKTFFLKNKGPLFQGNLRSICSIRIEVSLRENIILKPETKEIVPVYPDLQPYSLMVMELKEILSEKIRAILSRDKARDVYDLWFLLKKDTQVDINFIEKKLEYYGMQYSKDNLISKIKGKKDVWKKELKDLLTVTIPDFDKITEYITSKLT